MPLADIYLGDVWAIALGIIGLLLSLQGLWLVCRALWPRLVERSAARCELRPVASFFLGLLVSAAALFVGVGAGKRLGAPGQMAGFAILFFYVIYSGIGVAGFVTHIGRRLESPADAVRSWRATVRGGVALQLAYLIPLLGWFGILPISFVVGCGAATMAIFSRARPPARSDPVSAKPSDPLYRSAVESSSYDAQGATR
ncbi:MAG TPA: hypothetical protein VG326_15650 [Tepidisphaeraceae bacterium]|jgi:hypothetical protein|nr:hypothetical protein [Tepidisphaeraceae bacterium]